MVFYSLCFSIIYHFCSRNVKSKINKSIKLIAAIDFLIRCLLLIVTYLAICNTINLSFVLQICIVLFSLVLNLLIGWRLYEYLRFNVGKDELTKDEIDYVIKDYTNEQEMLINKSSDEQLEINSAYRMTVYSGYSKLVTLIIILGGIMGFSLFGINYRMIIVIVASIFLMIYLYLTEKNFLYCMRIKRSKEKFLLEITLLI